MSVNKVAIVAIKYEEPEWQETKKCIDACDVPTVYMERNPKGVGSLAHAINAGFRVAKNYYDPEYVWFVTNVTFSKKIFTEICEYLDMFPEFAAIHPCFDSDHPHIRQTTNNHGSHEFVSAVPFIEFTAPIVRSDVFEKFPLDESMPYWGHDLDFGYRVRQAGYQIGVYHGEKLGHTYIRHKNQTNPYTKMRRKLRRQTDQATRQALFNKYGEKWKDLRWPKVDTEIGSFYNQVIQTQF